MSPEHEAADKGRMWVDAGQPDRALREIAPYLAANPGDSDLLLVAASAHIGLSLYRDALEDAQRVLAVSPHNEHAWRLASIAHSNLSQHDEAIAAAETAHRLAPNSWRTLLQVVFADLHAERITARTREFVARAAAIAPEEPLVHLVTGMVAMHSRRKKGAKEAFQEVLRLDPGNTGAQNGLALLSLSRGNAGKAAAGFIDVLATKPTHEVAVHNVQVSIMRALAGFHVILWLMWVVARAASLPVFTGRDGGDLFVGTLFRVALAVLTTLCVVGYVARLRWQAGRRFAQFARAAMNSERGLRRWAVALATVWALMVVAAFVPDLFARLCYFLCLVPLIIGVVSARGATARLKERAKDL